MHEIMFQKRTQPLIFLASLFLIVAILSLARAVFIPLALASLLSFLLGPLVRFVQRRGLKRIPAVLIVSAIAFVSLGILFWAIMSQGVSLANNLPNYEKIIRKKITNMRGGETSPLAKVVGTTARVTKELENEDAKNESSPLSSLFGFRRNEPMTVVVQSRPGEVLTFYVTTAREVIQYVASIGLVIALVIVMLIFREELRDRFIRLTGCSRLTVTTKALDEAAYRISEYMFRKTIINGIYGVVIGIGLFLIGVPFAILWGVLVALLRAIPTLGIFLSAAPAVILSIIAFEGWTPFFLVVGLYVIVELITMNLFEPRFYGRQIGLLPVATMVSLTFWTWLWGPVGLVLAIPLTVCLAVLGKYVPQFEYLNILLSQEPAMDTPLRYYQRLLARDQDEAMDIVDQHLDNNSEEFLADNIFLPALSYARRDSISGDLSEADQLFFYESTQEILEHLQTSDPETEANNMPAGNGKVFQSVLGFPVNDEGDRLTLVLIEQLTRKHGVFMEICPARMLTAEVLQVVQKKNPTVICLASVAPGELAQTRFMCKRLNQHFPAIEIVVARLGITDDFAKEEKILKGSGADYICPDVHQTSRRLVELVYHPAQQNQAAESSKVGS